MNLEIFWMRHAISCNNIKKKREKIAGFYKMKDPSILLEAMLTIIEMREYLPKKMKDCKLVFCSEMKRTMQTAIFNYPTHFIKGKIKIIKGINEYAQIYDIGYGNVPQKISSLKKELKFSIIYLYNFIKKSDPKKYKKYTNYTLYKYLDKCRDINKTLDKLIDNLYSDINHTVFNNLIEPQEEENNIVTCLNNYLKPKKISNIVIVSHSNFLAINILKNNNDFLHLIRTNDKKLYNNQILYKHYIKTPRDEVKITEKIYPYGCVYKKTQLSCFYNYNMLHKYAHKTTTNKPNKTITNKIKLLTKKKNKTISLQINFDNNDKTCSNNISNKPTKKPTKKSTKKSPKKSPKRK